MPGLESLQRILELRQEPLEAQEPPKNTHEYNNAVNSYIATAQEPTLALIRARKARSSESAWANLSGEDIAEIKERFSSYKEGIAAQMARLAPVESMLYDFGDELGRLSGSLKLLQQQLSQLSSNLVLQKTTTEYLNPIIVDLMVPPATVKAILKAPVNPQWVENIRVLNEKLALVESVKTGKSDLSTLYKDSQALVDLENELAMLNAKCVERIRDFMIAKIKLLRSSLAAASSQAVQKELLDVKEAYFFLRDHHSDLANELQLAYIFTMRWYYRTRFAKYLYAIEKLHTHNIDLSTVLGSTNSADDKSDIFGLRNWVGKNSLQPRSTSSAPRMTMNEYLLSIDKRIQILDERGKPEKAARAIPSQIAETTPFVYWLEFVYHQWCIALVDNIVVEYLFMVDFFYKGQEKFEPLATLYSKNAGDDEMSKDWSHFMFADVFSMGSLFVTWLLQKQLLSLPRTVASSSSSRTALSGANQGTCDAYGVLLMIRLTQSEQSLLHNRFHIPVVDHHLNSNLMILWPHFTKVVDLNCEAMKSLSLRSQGHKSTDAAMAPLPLSQQFAHFLLGLLKLASPPHMEGDFRGEPLATSINRLKNDFESILTRVSNQIFAGKRKGAEKEVFLYNNYFLVVNILRNEVDGERYSDIIDEQVKHFDALCNAYKQH